MCIDELDSFFESFYQTGFTGFFFFFLSFLMKLRKLNPTLSEAIIKMRSAHSLSVLLKY
jgi:hypothetical protein